MDRFKELSEDITAGILDSERELWKIPETGYNEWETSAYMAKVFRKLGYELTEAGDIPGFYTLLDAGKEGPTLLILAELDSLICASHPDSNPQTGAVHACGHNAQCAAMVGIAAALKQPGALDGMSGKIKLCLVPAEEGIEIEFRLKLIQEGRIKFVDGKSEFLSRGYFDDCDLAMMIHTAVSEDESKRFFLTKGGNGLIRKRIKFKGLASHAGGSPHKGINALYAANLALNAINALRETFKEEDFIRIHPIITKGGDAVNAIPAEVFLESYVRGANADSIARENQKVNRAIAGCAAAMGAEAVVTDIGGSLPLHNDKGFADIAFEVMEELVGRDAVDYRLRDIWRASSTDMGDISSVMPAIHPYATGGVGILHGNDFRIKDPYSACVNSAKLQLMLACRLLSDGAAAARAIIENAKPVFKSIKDYLEYKKNMGKELNLVKHLGGGKIEIQYI